MKCAQILSFKSSLAGRVYFCCSCYLCPCIVLFCYVFSFSPLVENTFWVHLGRGEGLYKIYFVQYIFSWNISVCVLSPNLFGLQYLAIPTQKIRHSCSSPKSPRLMHYPQANKLSQRTSSTNLGPVGPPRLLV